MLKICDGNKQKTCPTNVRKAFKKCPKNVKHVKHMSNQYQKSVRQVSNKFPESLHRVSEKCPTSVETYVFLNVKQVSQKCQVTLFNKNSISQKYPKIVQTVSQKYPKRIKKTPKCLPTISKIVKICQKCAYNSPTHICDMFFCI
jgi:predicted negative regulator of RcsB-dependent stress response